MLPTLATDSASRTGLFYVCHYDDNSDYILLNDEHNITGIIGGEFGSRPCSNGPGGPTWSRRYAVAVAGSAPSCSHARDKAPFEPLFQGLRGKFMRGVEAARRRGGEAAPSSSYERPAWIFIILIKKTRRSAA